MIPQTGQYTSGSLVSPHKFSNWMDAVSRGTSDGLNIFLNIAAMLVVVLALVSLLNAALSLFPDVGGEALSMQRILGMLLAPVTWLMGIPWEECFVAGNLLGTKTVLNEVNRLFAACQDRSNSPLQAKRNHYDLCSVWFSPTSPQSES